jgi:hypothetical protein
MYPLINGTMQPLIRRLIEGRMLPTVGGRPDQVNQPLKLQSDNQISNGRMDPDGSGIASDDPLMARIKAQSGEPKGTITNLNVQVTTELRKRISKFMVMEDVASLRSYVTALIEEDLEKRGY